MDQPAIFSATLGLSHPWKVIAVSFTKEENRLDITVDYAHGSVFTCPQCGSDGKTCYSETETWYHDDFLRYATYLHARVPRIECCCGISTVDRPWSRPGSKFSLLT